MFNLAISQRFDLEATEGFFSKMSIIGERARHLTTKELREEYDQALSEVIEGQVPSARPELIKMARQHGVNCVDRITAEVCVHHGIDIFAVLAIGYMLDASVMIEDTGGDLILLIDPWFPLTEAGSASMAWLSPEVRWVGKGIEVTLPETLAMASVGRPLRDIVSHPVLDRHDLSIVSIDQTATGKMTLKTDADLTSLSVDDLVQLTTPQS